MNIESSAVAVVHYISLTADLTVESLNFQITGCTEPYILLSKTNDINQELLARAVSLLQTSRDVQMIVFSGGAWPLLFSKKSWALTVGAKQLEGIGEKLAAELLSQARLIRQFGVLQINLLPGD
jgi:hypothetical protein